MKRVYVKEEYCVGCGLCEVHCATAHSPYPGNILKAFKVGKIRPMPRVKVQRRGASSFAWQCRHCDEPLCVSSCITGALSKDSVTGIVSIDESRCISCCTCIVACPFGAIEEATVENSPYRRILKCDLCKDICDTPACVSNCPNNALVYEGRP